MSDLNYYEVLGVKKNSSQDDIKKAYRKLLKQYHPDVYKGDKEVAEKKSALFNEAYDVLSDKIKRKEYDSTLEAAYAEQTYEYTPPKYSNPYENTQKNNNYTTNSYDNYYSQSNRSNPFYNNTTYSRKHAQNYNYDYNNSYNPISNEVKIKKLLKFFIFFIFIIIIYAIMFVTTLINFNGLKSNSNTSSYIDNSYSDDDSYYNYDPYDYYNDQSDNELEYDHNTNLFIYQFFTEEQVETLYNRYGQNYKDFTNFEKYINNYIQNYYNNQNNFSDDYNY